MSLKVPEVSIISTSESEVVVKEEEEEDEGQEETAEVWLLRHLVQLIGCDDQSAEALTSSDHAPLDDLLTSDDPQRALFITVRKVRPFISEPVLVDALSRIHPQMYKKTSPKPARRNRSKKRKKKKSDGKSKSPEKTVRNQSNPRKMAGKSKSPTKKTETVKEGEGKRKKKKSKAGNAEKKEEPKEARRAKTDIERELVVAPPAIEMVFEWFTEREIPPFEQFVFIVPKDTVPSEGQVFDDLYHVGYMKNTRFLKNALSTAQTILLDDFTFSMKLDMLLLFNHINERKTPEELVLERFVINCVARHLCVDAGIRWDSTSSPTSSSSSDERSVSLILNHTIQLFCHKPDRGDRNCLLLQLSFFDIDQLTEQTHIPQCAARLLRAASQLSSLHFLFSDDVIEWLRKMFLYLVDLFSTILAHHITRKSNLLLHYDSDKEVGPICASFQPFVTSTRELSQILFESAEDRVAVEKLVFSFHIVTVLEEELDATIDKVRSLCSESRDMTMDRGAIHAAHEILQKLSHFLDENCLESAVESGNMESLRTLARTMVHYNRRIDKLMTTLA